MRRRSMMFAGCIAAVAVASGAVALAVAIAEPGHTPLHVACKHHNHGPKWHAGHGRALGEPQSRSLRPELDEPRSGRAITSPGRGR